MDYYFLEVHHKQIGSWGLFNNLDSSIDEYLLPDSAKKDVQKNAYRDFYRKNLQAKNAMVISIDEVCEELHEYLDIRFEEAAR